MKSLINIVYYLIHKIQKKIRLSAVRDSIVDPTARLESGTSFISSTLGRYSFCGYDCEIYMTEIGAFCSIANGVVIGGNAHPIDWASTSPVFYNNVDTIKKKFSRHERNSPQKTVIGHDVWIGRNALIKQGVVIGSGAVIGMGTVVTKDVAPYAIVVGNPARVVKKRFSDDVVNSLLEVRWWDCSDIEIEASAKYIKSPQGFIFNVKKIIVDASVRDTDR